jgi:ankyrin repeat protein
MDLGTRTSDGGFFACPWPWCHSPGVSAVAHYLDRCRHRDDRAELDQKESNAPARWAVLGLALSLFVVGELPDGFWQRVFISRMAASPRASDLLLYAAYRGDLGTVKGLISRGVPVNAAAHGDWRTAMHAAAAKGDLPILRYLVSKGADIDALDRSGDSPLEVAASANRTEAVRFLTEGGAKRIRGDEAKRQKASHDKVREEIEKLNPDSKRLHEEEDSEIKENQPTDHIPQ